MRPDRCSLSCGQQWTNHLFTVVFVDLAGRLLLPSVQRFCRGVDPVPSQPTCCDLHCLETLRCARVANSWMTLWANRGVCSESSPNNRPNCPNVGHHVSQTHCLYPILPESKALKPQSSRLEATTPTGALSSNIAPTACQGVRRISGSTLVPLSSRSLSWLPHKTEGTTKRPGHTALEVSSKTICHVRPLFPKDGRERTSG